MTRIPELRTELERLDAAITTAQRQADEARALARPHEDTIAAAVDAAALKAAAAQVADGYERTAAALRAQRLRLAVTLDEAHADRRAALAALPKAEAAALHAATVAEHLAVVMAALVATMELTRTDHAADDRLEQCRRTIHAETRRQQAIMAQAESVRVVLTRLGE